MVETIGEDDCGSQLNRDAMFLRTNGANP